MVSPRPSHLPEPIPYVDVRRLLDVFAKDGRSGHSQIITEMSRHGFAVAPVSVWKWRTRNSIPMDRFLQLVYIAKQLGKKIKLEDYLVWP